MYRIRILYCLLLLTLGIKSTIYGQTDSIFWFGAPEVIADHGDRPIRIFCTSTTEDVNITLSQPANSNFTPIQFSLSKGDSYNIDLTPWIGNIETSPNRVSNNGLLLKATGLITAYYEVVPFYNPDIFSLKGDNALGLEFWIPGQNHYFNGPYGGVPRSGYTIVATENNTLVTIIPKNDLVGHPAGIPFNIVLNRGQCYATRSISAAAGRHVGGDYITSDKRIAVTLKDDSLGLGIGCWDLGGDQIIPTRIIGQEYIVTRGALTPDDRFFITATVDGTNIYLDGSGTPIRTLDAGEIGNFSLKNPSVLIIADQPIYVLHVTGSGCELGFAIIPPYKCTGSKSVHFSRSTNDQFRLFVFTQSKFKSSFSIDGNSNILKSSDFMNVPGTNGEFVSAYIDLTNIIGVGVPVNVKNDIGVFHLGIINGRNGTSSRFGYFSNFGRPKSNNKNIVACSGDIIQLNSSYNINNQWYINGNNISSDSTIVISSDTSLTIKLISENIFACIDTSFFKVNINHGSEFIINSEICEGDNYIFNNKVLTDPGQYFDTLTAINGCDSTVQLNLIVNTRDTFVLNNFTCTPRDTGLFEHRFKNILGCDSIVLVYVSLLPDFIDTLSHEICSGDSIMLYGNWIYKTGFSSFNFQSIHGCDSIEIHEVRLLPINNNSVKIEYCLGDNFEGIEINKDTIILRNYSNQFGCDSLVFYHISLLPNSYKNDTFNICFGEKYRNIIMTRDTIFLDSFYNKDFCDSIVSHYIHVNEIPEIQIFGNPILCKDTEAELSVIGAENYSWSTGNITDKIIINKSGFYFVDGTDKNGCKNRDSFVVITPTLVLDFGFEPPTCPEIDDGYIWIVDDNDNYSYSINSVRSDKQSLNLGPGKYIIEIEDKYGCLKKDSIELIEPDLLTISLPDTIHDYIGNTVSLIPRVNLNIDSTKWFPSKYLSCDTCLITRAIVQKGFQYFIKVKDSRGCIVYDSIYIKGLIRNIYVPNVFSPTGDHINDKFILFSNDGYKIINQLEIYDRWGELLYLENELPFNNTNFGWDGTHNGDAMNPGVYTYVARVLRTDGLEEILFGDVTLVR